MLEMCYAIYTSKGIAKICLWETKLVSTGGRCCNTGRFFVVVNSQYASRKLCSSILGILSVKTNILSLMGIETLLGASECV